MKGSALVSDHRHLWAKKNFSLPGIDVLKNRVKNGGGLTAKTIAIVLLLLYFDFAFS